MQNHLQLKLFDKELEENFCLSVEFEFDDFDFLFYDKPTCYYNLKNIDSKVSSFEQLTYYAEVFFYLNPDIDFKIFLGLFLSIANTDFSKTIRTYSKGRVKHMCEHVYNERKIPHCSQWRRIIFNPSKIIRNDEKMSIAGEIFKRHLSITSLDVEKAVAQLKMANIEIKASRISDILSCSQKTVQRNMTTDIKNNIKKSNAFIRRQKKVQKIIEYIDVLSEGGNKVKIRELRKFIAVKDYSVIKEAFSIYKESL